MTEYGTRVCNWCPACGVADLLGRVIITLQSKYLKASRVRVNFDNVLLYRKSKLRDVLCCLRVSKLPAVLPSIWQFVCVYIIFRNITQVIETSKETFSNQVGHKALVFTTTKTATRSGITRRIHRENNFILLCAYSWFYVVSIPGCIGTIK